MNLLFVRDKGEYNAILSLAQVKEKSKESIRGLAGGIISCPCLPLRGGSKFHATGKINFVAHRRTMIEERARPKKKRYAQKRRSETLLRGNMGGLLRKKKKLVVARGRGWPASI